MPCGNASGRPFFASCRNRFERFATTRMRDFFVSDTSQVHLEIWGGPCRFSSDYRILCLAH